MSHGAASGWPALPPLPFYFLELLVGLIQALVFMLLTAVFLKLICDHGDDHEEEGDIPLEPFPAFDHGHEPWEAEKQHTTHNTNMHTMFD